MNPSMPGDGFAQFIMTAVVIVFVIVIAMFVFNAVKGVAEWSNNNAQPTLIVPARIVNKRLQVTHHHHRPNDSTHHASATQYYATFELENGTRLEFQISGRESGLLAEGDAGELTHQGTRYHGFRRLNSGGPTPA